MTWEVDGVLSQRARVLITVKASPEPSQTYGDTVCVAGVWLREGKPEWVRIYPVAFRHLQSEQQFKKYEVIEVDLTRSTTDSRHESHRPNWETLTRDGLKPLSPKARGPILEKLIGPTMCELREGVQHDLTAQSLGLVEVREMKPLIFENHGPWTRKQVDGMRTFMSQPGLFGEVDDTPELTPPRYKVKYKYKCASATCPNWHEQRILDWELNALQHHNRHASDADLRALITAKFHEEMWNERVRTYFFVGNFADIAKRRSYSVLGVYRPPRESDWGSTLF